jgi:hypothetical protein
MGMKLSSTNGRWSIIGGEEEEEEEEEEEDLNNRDTCDLSQECHSQVSL